MHFVKITDQNHIPVSFRFFWTERIRSVFAQNQVNYHPHYPKGFTWHFIETKAIKHD